MRTVLVAVLALVPGIATAGPRSGGGGSGGGGGRLGQVSKGIGSATQGAGGGQRSSGTSYDQVRADGDLYYREQIGPETVVIARDGTIVRRYITPRPATGGPSNFNFFLGGQKVYESDGALALALSFDDRWFRLAGGFTHYWENRMGGEPLTMTMPTLTAGLRIDDHGGASKVFVEGGVAYVKTANDPMVDSSITGGVAGIHLEHRLGAPTIVGDAHGMWFEAGVRAYRARLGVRISHVEAAITVLDFNVGPALFGPEVGLAF